MKSKKAKHGQTILAYVVLILLSFLCLFFFYILIVNATRSHADLQKGFSAIPGTYFLENLKNVANDGSFPMFKGILNSLIVSTCSAALCTYFSSLTAYGLYAYDFKAKKAAFTFIMAILVMPTQVTAMGFLRLYSILCTAIFSRLFRCRLWKRQGLTAPENSGLSTGSCFRS